MPWTFNPFTGSFDQKGSGGGGGASYIDGEVATYADLPLDGTAALNSAWLVRTASGVWPVSRKQAGIYIRTATGGSNRDSDYTYAGTMPDVFSDSQFLLYDNTDTSKNLAFDLGSISTGQTRTLTAPNASGRIQIEGQPIGDTTPAAVTATNLTANTRLALPSSAAGTPVAGDLYRVTDTLRFRDASNTERTLLSGAGNLANLTDVATARSNLGLGSAATQASTAFANASHTHAAADVTSGVFDNARINFAAPSAIGSTTAAAGTFTTLTANNGTLTASAPALTIQQTWNSSATAFQGFEVQVTNTASNANSNLFRCLVGGTEVFGVRRDGSAVSAVGFLSNNGFRAIGNGNSGGQVILSSNGHYCWNDSTTSTFGTQDLILRRDAAGVLAQYNGANSQEQRLYSTFTSSTNYQRMTIKSVRQTLSALSGASATTTGTFIPDGAVVVGVTTRVATALTGATGYTIGDGTDADRWGDITGTAVGTTSDNRDWTAGTIECFTAGGNVTLTAKGSNFTAGAIEISVFYLAGEAD